MNPPQHRECVVCLRQVDCYSTRFCRACSEERQARIDARLKAFSALLDENNGRIRKVLAQDDAVLNEEDLAKYKAYCNKYY